MSKNIIKKDFDFPWKYSSNPVLGELTLKYAGKSILDIGCGTCQLYRYLQSKNWKGEYIGIDIKKYEKELYPENVKLIVGDAFEVEFPEADTCILYDILEHVEDPVKLLSKALNAAEKNVLIAIPKRNEDLWKLGIVEYHQLDKTHKHCGFSKNEVYKLVKLAGGKITVYKELFPISAKNLVGFWDNIIPKAIIHLLTKMFPSKMYYQEIWCEIRKL